MIALALLFPLAAAAPDAAADPDAALLNAARGLAAAEADAADLRAGGYAALAARGHVARVAAAATARDAAARRDLADRLDAAAIPAPAGGGGGSFSNFDPAPLLDRHRAGLRDGLARANAAATAWSDRAARLRPLVAAGAAAAAEVAAATAAADVANGRAAFLAARLRRAGLAADDVAVLNLAAAAPRASEDAPPGTAGGETPRLLLGDAEVRLAGVALAARADAARADAADHGARGDRLSALAASGASNPAEVAAARRAAARATATAADADALRNRLAGLRIDGETAVLVPAEGALSGLD